MKQKIAQASDDAQGRQYRIEYYSRQRTTLFCLLDAALVSSQNTLCQRVLIGSRMRHCLRLLAATFLACSAKGSGVSVAAPLVPTNPPVCASLPGADTLTRVQKHFVIVGETHGTTETPRLFGNLVCAFARVKPVIVALEYDKSSTPVLQKYLRSEGTSRDEADLLASNIWDKSVADGRSSVAMLALLKQLRSLRSAGFKIELYGTQPNDGPFTDQHYYELAMAAEWARIAGQNPRATVLILVGNIHARVAGDKDLPFLPAASHLRLSDTLSMSPVPSGGTAWNCMSDGCKAHATMAGAFRTPFVGEMSSPANGYNGSYSVGSPFTASQPVKH